MEKIRKKSMIEESIALICLIAFIILGIIFDCSQDSIGPLVENFDTVSLGQLRGFVSYFQIAVNILAYNYMQCKNERRKEGDDVFTIEAAIRTVLALFRLSEDRIDFLTSQILMSSHKVKGEIEPSEFDLSFYENGFRYYAFENDIDHDMQSHIMMYSFQTTPEKILLRFCEKAKVIGISATATVPSVIGNYDIDYLKNKMQKVLDYLKILEVIKKEHIIMMILE